MKKTLNLKHFYQKKDYLCGPTALKIAFSFFKKTYSEKKLLKKHEKLLKKRGMNHKLMLKEIKKNNLFYKEIKKASIKDIIKFIDKNYPIIVNYYISEEKTGHFAVVKGYDTKKKTLILSDPEYSKSHLMSFKNFQNVWYNTNKSSKKWMVVIGKKKIN